MYSFSYGAYDSDVIAELVVTGQVEQIPRQLFESGRKAVDSTDPAYRICPTFEQLTVISAS
jgi:hypothetical protein